MSDYNDIYGQCRQPPSLHLEELSESDPLERLAWSPNGNHILYLNEGEPMRSPHPILCANITPIVATPSPSSDGFLDSILCDDVAINPEITVAPHPPQDHPLLNTSDIGPSPSTTSFCPPAKANVIPIPSRDPLQDMMALLEKLDNFHIGPSQLGPRSTLSPANVNAIVSPSRGLLGDSTAFNRLLEISGIEPSRLGTSSSASPANANEEEPVSFLYDIKGLEALKADLKEFKTVVSLVVRLATDNEQSVGPSGKKFVHSVSRDNGMTFMPLKDSYIWVADEHKQYFVLIYRPIVTFRVGTRTIVTLQHQMVMEYDQDGNFSMETSNIVSLKVAVKEAEKCRIPIQLAGPVVKKQKQPRDTSSSTRRKRAVLYISLEQIKTHHDKTLAQAAKAIGVSVSKLKKTIEGYGLKNWTNFTFQCKKDLSEKATHLSLTASPHGGDVSNTSALTVLNQSVQYKNWSMPLQAGNVNQSAASSSSRPDEKLIQHELHSQPWNQHFTRPPPGNNRRPVTVMAKYGKKNMKFVLTSESKKEDLENEVTKRTDLKVGSFYLDYKDEAGVWIYIGCDADLKECMDSFKSSDRSTVEMVVQLND